jgi:hypothetical protein
MGSKQLDLTGMRFNMLKIESKLPSRVFGDKSKYYYKRMWLCICDCGNKTEVNTGALTSGKTKSCGCLKNKTNAENSRKSRHLMVKKDGGYRSIFRMYNNNAISRGYEFNLDFDYFIKLLSMNCFYCGSEPNNWYKKTYYNVVYNGIDRRDNSKGYTLDNSVSCCKMCNIAKNNNSEDDFMNWIKRINEYQRLKQEFNNQKQKVK